MKRRDFVHTAIHAAAGSTLLGSLGKQSLNAKLVQKLLNFNPDNDRVLVLIFLNGGNDGLNSVVPINQLTELNALRPHVVLPENKLIKLGNGTNLGFHPSMVGMHNLYDEGKLKVIRGVGYTDQNFSHFRSSDIWMSGSDSHEVIGTGWMGRYLNLTYTDYPDNYPNSGMPDPLSLELGYNNSLLFNGPIANMSVVVNGERDFYALIDDREEEIPDSFYGDKIEHVKLIKRHSQVYGEVIRDAAQKVTQQYSGYPQTSLAQQLKICARMIAGGLKTPIYKVEIGGFDTHAAQVEDGDHTRGSHSYLLSVLDQAITAFMKDLEMLGVADRVTGMTFSEFGRRIVSNASNGTDHGSAGPIFIFGNKVEGGILGSGYNLDLGMTYEDNLEHEYDYRQVYGSLLEQWLCVGDTRRNNSLNGDYDTLPIMQPGTCLFTSVNNPEENALFKMKVAPNPASSQAVLTMDSFEGYATIDLIDLSGRRIRMIHAGRMEKGTTKVNFDVSYLPAGLYFIRLRTRKNVRTLKMIKQ